MSQGEWMENCTAGFNLQSGSSCSRNKEFGCLSSLFHIYCPLQNFTPLKDSPCCHFTSFLKMRFAFSSMGKIKPGLGSHALYVCIHAFESVLTPGNCLD